MARKRASHLTYNTLYAYFALEGRGWEASHYAYSPHTMTGQWVTNAETNCGMIIQRPPLQREPIYQRAPLNSVKFAHTSGEGIHYSILASDGYWSEFCPVVMTDPCGCVRNIVVGETLEEFLRMGLCVGYSALANYLPDAEGNWDDPSQARVLATVEEPQDERAATQALALAKLANHFGLRPLENLAARLTELQQRFQPLIQPAPALDFDWNRQSDSSSEVKAMLALLLAQFRPGDRVIWDREETPRWVSVPARVVSVGRDRVMILLIDPVTSHEVMRRVSPYNLRKQEPL